MASRSHLARILCALALCFAALAAPAVADTEPNDFIYQGEGPISGGAAVNGAVADPDAGDWYVLYMTGQQQVHVTHTGCPSVVLTDTDGKPLSLDYTTPTGGTARYFVHVYDGDETYDCRNNDTAQAYSFTVSPGAAVVTGPAAKLTIQQTSEPNETPSQAFGPLEAGPLYMGSIDTSNDADWFTFYTQPGINPVDVAVYDSDTSLKDDYDCEEHLALWKADPSSGDSYDNELDARTNESGVIHHVTFTSETAGQYWIQMSVSSSECLHGHWLMRIESPAAIASSLPAPAPVETPPAEQPAVAPQKTAYLTSASLRRRLARYSGRISSGGDCLGSRRVQLRRSGSGSHSFGTTYTRPNGTFTIQRGHRVRGHVYAWVAPSQTASSVCRGVRSGTIRG